MTKSELRSQSPGAEIQPPVSEEDFQRERIYLSLVLNNFLSDYLLRLYAAFEGDFIQAIVLANIAHHNVQPMIKLLDSDPAAVRRMFLAPTADAGWMLPCNAFSISEALHIPRETVRRKVAALVRKGWLSQNAKKKELFVTRLPGEVFFQFNLEMTNDLLRTADRLKAKLGAASDPLSAEGDNAAR